MKDTTKHFIIGLALSILLALLAFFATYVVGYNDYYFDEYISTLSTNDSLPKILAICLVPNLLPFHFFLNKRNYHAVRGILAGMLLWAVVILYLMFLY